MLTPSLLLNAYAHGLFPMADDAQAEDIFWMDPTERCILPLNNFHIPRRLARTVRQEKYKITINHCFADVIQTCGTYASTRKKTWINSTIINLYCELHEMGHAHSVEAWLDDNLVGGLYGVSLGRAFFGESMFSRARDASKVALVHCAARLIQNGFTLLDAQFENTHLDQFGATILSREHYLGFLELALAWVGGTAAPSFSAGDAVSGAVAIGLLQSNTQTS